MKILNVFRLEPARIYGIVVASLAVALAFGLKLTEGQQAAFLGLAAAIIGAFEHTRSMVSPTARTEERRDQTKPEAPPEP